MKFQEQYKKEINSISPTEEQCQRIYAGVYEKIKSSETSTDFKQSDHQNNTNSVTIAAKSRKTPLKLKTIAISGASAACVVIIAGVVFITHFRNNDNSFWDSPQTGNGTNSSVTENISYSSGLSDDILYSSADKAWTAEESTDGITSESVSSEIDDISDLKDNAQFGDTDYPRIEFYNDCNECVLYINNSSQRFISTNPPTGGSDENSSDASNVIQHYEFYESQNNLGVKLSVKIKADIISVYDENGSLIGFFAAE